MIKLLPAHGLPSLALAVGLVLAAFAPPHALAQSDTASADSRAFPETGYAVSDDAMWTFFSEHGGVTTFGPPISREFTLMGSPTQLFEFAALQVNMDGSLQPMQLSDPGLLPYTHFDGLTVPAASEAPAMVAPTSEQPAYAQRLLEFLRASVPDTWHGQPVGFLSVFAGSAGPSIPDDALLAGVQVWGLPVSTPAADPNNPNFIYQRFQNGVLMYDATTGTTAPLPLGMYLRDLLSHGNVPADLAAEAATSPLSNPVTLTNTDLSSAFVPDVG